MKHSVGTLLAASALVIGFGTAPAVAQNARALLQAADAAIGASKVNSMQFTAKGRYSYLGQNFTVNDDWNRTDMQSYVLTIDYPSKSYKEEMVRVQGNNPKIGGGAGFPIVGEQRANAYGNGNLRLDHECARPPAAAERSGGNAPDVRRGEPVWLHQDGVGRPNATVSDREFITQGKNVKVVSFTTMGKWRATGEFNAQNMLERVVTWIPSPMMGDMQVEIRYSDWRDVGNGIKAPYHIHMHQGDHPLVRGMNQFDAQGDRCEGQRAGRCPDRS
jgi:hypothetical protein